MTCPDIFYAGKKLAQCQCPQEADCRPWVVKATSTDAKIWRDVNKRVSDKCKPCSPRRGDSEKRMRYCISRYLHQALVVADSLKVSKETSCTMKSPYIINYEPPRGFMVSKFSTYDRTNDSFDHIMHYRQLMTLDIGNDTLLCKVFPAILHGQAISWFHRLPINSINNFWDLSEAFMGQYL
ncbi:hypothetical protein CK203_027483 [Vitis vinifera]|uniref:Retrotransposon gag domain-containing protein n=1 Tax=Vitis vinifera TaxID=29760 RepID=A0A438JB80_VITVI|nr:hypothetical protein CK203_027483 [Vitis vinifera]